MPTKVKKCRGCGRELGLDVIECGACGHKDEPKATRRRTWDTVWTYSLSYGSKEEPDRSGMAGGKDTLGESIKDMFRMVTYYLGLGYVVSAKIHEHCKLCAGTGRVPKKRTQRLYVSKPCPDCKGRQGQTIDCGRFDLSNGVTINNDAR